MIRPDDFTPYPTLDRHDTLANETAQLWFVRAPRKYLAAVDGFRSQVTGRDAERARVGPNRATSGGVDDQVAEADDRLERGPRAVGDAP